MEQLIIIGLLLVIILLLCDRKFTNQHPKEKSAEAHLTVPSIMGKTKIEERKLQPSDADQGQGESSVINVNNFDSETKEEVFENTASKKELDEILVKNNDWEYEEEDWQYQDDSKIESGFATGVTFQELSTAGQLLQQEVLETDLEKQAVNIIQKIQETELFDLLENSLGDASKRIVALLSQSISNKVEDISVKKRQDNAEGFDIGEFV
ncbi:MULTISPECIES: hypothetical protein [Chryseobacterium]|uniref:Conjugal transfer protein TraD n=2 Tax=Chryseobacterium TaxID=59732 RepID=A0AAD0YL39_CHRNA|nr:MULTISPECIES: hypothetical protein [Chryseobacterium]AZA89828.1 hypothetical protein EG343_03890 [Chryseobacterium nakagawai]SMP12297.1 hypothetical protein SAMN06264346_102433 [Chryseobacterium profundimaris]VEH21231.1 Uncharacterised protein [Chryseobacterium nakagawai]VFA41300.1 Uncharacterised protein [Chryseobacterium indologenes]